MKQANSSKRSQDPCKEADLDHESDSDVELVDIGCSFCLITESSLLIMNLRHLFLHFNSHFHLLPFMLYPLLFFLYYSVEVPAPPRFFQPVSLEWQTQKATQFGLAPPSKFIWADSNLVELPKGQLPVLKDMGKDGNCLPRAISYCLTGRQGNYAFFRHLVCDHMEQRGLAARYVRKMRIDRTWMTETELLAFSDIFGVPIYCCSESHSGANDWQYHRYWNVGRAHREPNPADGALFVANHPHKTHFQVVLQP